MSWVKGKKAEETLRGERAADQASDEEMPLGKGGESVPHERVRCGHAKNRGGAVGAG